MPPKAKDKGKGGGSSKPKEDKTFGMKNKKGSKGQAAVKLHEQQSANAGKNKEVISKEKAREQQKKAKEADAAHKAEVADLFKPIQPAQKVPFGTDPKTVVCMYFKSGKCDKGRKCKFSHDLNIDRKSEKKDIYTDARNDEKKNEDTMDKWNEDKLREVVLSKHGNPKTTTDIVCKHFIDAIENGRYGWFWECPNGGSECKYRHALPPGFVLSSQKKKEEQKEKEREISLEDFIEVERHKLGSNLTPVTLESFAAWKANRKSKKEAEEEATSKAKQAQANAGKSTGMSGRDLFTYNPQLYQDSDDEEDEWDLAKYRKETEEAREKRELERIAMLQKGVDGLGISERHGDG